MNITTTQPSPQHAGKSATQRPLILALTGHSDTGKDTIANLLAPAHGFARVAFADALRREVTDTWRIDMRMLTDRATKEVAIPALAAGMCSATDFMLWCTDAGESLTQPRSARWVLQRWATFQRRYDTHHYTRIAQRWIESLIGCGWHRIVVTDLRDDIEEAMLRQLGAKIVRVHRPDRTPLAADTATHVSEQHLRIQADADIVNDGGLMALAEATVRCVDELLEGHAGAWQ